MNGMNSHQPWANVAVFEDLTDGQGLETFLQTRGLEARTYDDKLVRVFLFLRPPRVTYRVQVRRSALHHADELVAGLALEKVRRAIRCPDCHSLHIVYPQMTRKFILPTILLHLCVIFRIVEHECYCEQCHYDWQLPPPATLAASAPNAKFSPEPNQTN